MRLIIFVAFCLMIAAAARAAPQCGTSGQRSGCSSKQTYPCSWNAHQCEFQYDFISFVCDATPESAAVSVSCTPTDSAKKYDVEVLDAIQFGAKRSWIPEYTCQNEDGCATWSTGAYSWSGTTDFGEGDDIGPMSFYTVVSMLDHNTCLDVTCTIEVN
jgi:hypothetical protein